MSTGDTGLTQDLVFDILSSARRRYVLYMLNTRGAMELTTLAEHVAAQENDVDVEELTKQQRKRVYVSLYQTHVPKLEDAGLVTYDDETSIVALHDQAEELDQYLGAESRSFPWQYVYLGLAVVGLVALGLTTAGVGPLSETVVAVGLVGAVLVTATIHVGVWASSRSGTLERFRDLQ